MRVLLDENLDHRLRIHFASDVTIATIAERGWKGKENGELLRTAQAEFDVFITMDRGIEHQQNLVLLDLAVIILRATSNRLADLLPLMPEVNQVLLRLRAGELVLVPAWTQTPAAR